MKTWKIEIKLTVSDTWINDGFDANKRVEEIAQKVGELLPWAREDELSIECQVKEIKNPRHIPVLK